MCHAAVRALSLRRLVWPSLRIVQVRVLGVTRRALRGSPVLHEEVWVVDEPKITVEVWINMEEVGMELLIGRHNGIYEID